VLLLVPVALELPTLDDSLILYILPPTVTLRGMSCPYVSKKVLNDWHFSWSEFEESSAAERAALQESLSFRKEFTQMVAFGYEKDCTV
jgi:hypothetical protein